MIIKSAINKLNDNEEAEIKMTASFLLPSFEIEKGLLKKGYNRIAGIDEAGRGALAGPLAISLIIYSKSFISSPNDKIIKNVNDSKKLTAGKREKLFKTISQYSEYACTMYASHRTIDKININKATEYAIIKALENIKVKPDIILLDGNFSFNLGIPVISIKQGDSKSISIASASIFAKVKRDRVMDRIDRIYPGYDFKTNKGYGTKKHREAISKIGFTKIHRKTYAPVKNILENSYQLFQDENQLF